MTASLMTNFMLEIPMSRPLEMKVRVMSRSRSFRRSRSQGHEVIAWVLAAYLSKNGYHFDH